MIKVVAAVIWKDGKLLICQRNRNKNLAYFWEFPGGKIEAGETPQQALIRECQEELSVTIAPKEIVGVTLHAYETFSVELTFIEAEIIEGVPQKTEHEAIAWVTRAELDQYTFCPGDTEVLSIVLRKFI